MHIPTRRGQALIESIVAMSVLIIGFLAVLTLLNQSYGLNRSVADNLTATYLASEGVEMVKNIIDTNAKNGTTWNDVGVTLPGDYILAPDGRSLVAGNPALYYDTTANTYTYDSFGTRRSPFSRWIHVEFPGPDELMVDVTVSWTGRGGVNEKTVLEDHFLNWRLPPVAP